MGTGDVRRFVAQENLRRFETLLQNPGSPEQRAKLEALLAGARAELRALDGDDDADQPRDPDPLAPFSDPAPPSP